jgi:glycosyltransferase involved in cell wall biosynthesis
MLVGPRSTQELAYGMSIGFDLLIAGFEARNLPHVVIDRSQGMVGRKVGVFTAGGSFATLLMLSAFVRNLRPVAVIYLTIGTSKAGFLRDMVMIWLGSLFHRRIVLHLKGGGFLSFYEASPRWLRFLMRRTIARADTVIVLGELLRDQFSFVKGIESKLVVVPNGLPGPPPDRDQNYRQVTNSDSFRLLYLSNMIPSKGYLAVLEACRILYVERGIPIRCDFCGAFVATVHEGGKLTAQEATAAFRRLITEKGLTAVVRYHGVVRGERKREMLQAAHLFLLPTAYPWEGQPISIIEALAYGLPVIATRYRGIPEQVIDGRNGFLLDEKSPQAIADAVEKLWRQPALYEQFSQNAMRHYQHHFTREAHLNRLIPAIFGYDPSATTREALDS